MILPGFAVCGMALLTACARVQDPVAIEAVGTGAAGAAGSGGRTAGALLGAFEMGTSCFQLESDYPGVDDTALVNDECQPIASVPRAYADEVCLHGSGRLLEGSVINLASDCTCGYECTAASVVVCFRLLDPAAFPWGMSSTGAALEPLRSLAVDPVRIPLGTIIYVPAWDGVQMPGVDGLGGFLHDGCFRADDTGHGILGDYVALFGGSSGICTALASASPIAPQPAYLDAPHCVHLAP